MSRSNRDSSVVGEDNKERMIRIRNFLDYLLTELERVHGFKSPVRNQLRGFIEKEFGKDK